MNELVHIGNADISVKEYEGQRVVTFKDIDLVHGRPDGTARHRFAANKKHFVEGEDFFVVTPQSLEKSKMDGKRPTGIEEVNPRGTAFITEQGYLMLVKSFTDDLAWGVQRQLVNGYFKVKTIASDLSPQMQMLYGMLDQMAESERKANEAKQIAMKANETVENIKDAVRPVFDNWREEINSKFKRIQHYCDIPFNVLRNDMYTELEHRAGCDLNTRLRNLKKRLYESGAAKTEINNCRKIDVIEKDKKLQEIFSKIVSEYEIQYCA